MFQDNVYCHITSGLGAGLFAVICGSPVDVVKSRMMGGCHALHQCRFLLLLIVGGPRTLNSSPVLMLLGAHSVPAAGRMQDGATARPACLLAACTACCPSPPLLLPITRVSTLHLATLRMSPVLSQHATATCVQPLSCCQADGLMAAWLHATRTTSSAGALHLVPPHVCLHVVLFFSVCATVTEAFTAGELHSQGAAHPEGRAQHSAAGVRSPAGAAPGVYSGVVDCFVKTFKADGPLAFYNGFSSNFARLGEGLRSPAARAWQTG